MTPFISSEMDEGLSFAVVFSLTSKIEIKGEEKSGSFEESHDKEKCELVVGRRWHTKTRWQSSLVDVDAGASTGFFLASDKKRTWVKSCEDSSERESEIMVTASSLLGVEELDGLQP